MHANTTPSILYKLLNFIKNFFHMFEKSKIFTLRSLIFSDNKSFLLKAMNFFWSTVVEKCWCIQVS